MALSKQDQEVFEQLTAFYQRYAHDPVLMVWEMFGVAPDFWQAEFLWAVAAGERNISIRSGHGVGKSTAVAWVCIWAILTIDPVKIIVTAPTSAQLFDAMYAELKAWISKLPPVFATHILNVKSDRVERISNPAEAFISVRTARAENPEALQGGHAAAGLVIFIGDEASGIPEPVFEATSGSMAQERATTILLSNPTRTTGYFYDTQTKLKGGWWTRHVSSTTCPRVPQKWIDEMALRYGEESNAYRVRVLGEFPKGDDDTVLPLELADAALDRDIEGIDSTPEIWGLDVARFGSDSSALAKRKGRIMPEPVKKFKGYDTMQLVGAVVAEYNGLPLLKRPLEIMVDVIGVGGGVVDRLRELGLPVRGVNVSESPSIGKTYANMRAELWYKMRGWFSNRDCKIRDDADRTLITELTTVRYKFQSSGKLQIESKDDLRKRGVGSPDSADAFVLTFASDAATMQQGSSGLAWGKALIRGIKGIV